MPAGLGCSISITSETQRLGLPGWESNFNLFITNAPILYPLKTQDNIWFSGFFRGYKMGTLAGNGLLNNLRVVERARTNIIKYINWCHI